MLSGQSNRHNIKSNCPKSNQLTCISPLFTKNPTISQKLVVMQLIKYE